MERKTEFWAKKPSGISLKMRGKTEFWAKEPLGFHWKWRKRQNSHVEMSLFGKFTFLKSPFLDKIHIFKISFLTGFTFLKSQIFDRNSHFHNLILWQMSCFKEFTRGESHSLPNSHFENPIFNRIHISEISIFDRIHTWRISHFTEFTRGESHSFPNSHFENPIFYRIHIFEISTFDKIHIFEITHFWQNSHFRNHSFLTKIHISKICWNSTYQGTPLWIEMRLSIVRKKTVELPSFARA